MGGRGDTDFALVGGAFGDGEEGTGGAEADCEKTWFTSTV